MLTCRDYNGMSQNSRKRFKTMKFIKKLLRPFRKFLYKIIEKYRDFKAISNFKHERQIQRTHNRIRVGFICQYIPAWNKFEPVYNQLNRDNRFETFLICVPSGIQKNKLISSGDTRNDTYEYFHSHGYNCINALIGKNTWFKLETLGLDYIFYPRPYNSLMPSPYISRKVSRYTKICHIMYGMSLTKEILRTSLNRDFFRNVYYYFAESQYVAEEYKAMYSKTHIDGLQKSGYFGSPVLSLILERENSEASLWNFARDKYKIMWTPRWTTDLKLGGSNFFTYKDCLLQFSKEEDRLAFVFRPHPLALSNFVQTGEMTQEQADEFVLRCHQEPRIFLDQTQEYIPTMWNSDALITDISGVLPEYFVTGKPIIYCATNMILSLAEHTKKILEGCYIVNNFDELKQRVEMLLNGQDELKEKRKEIIEELWGKTLQHCAEMIVEELAH